jgi:protein-disulfide isomerase
MVLLILAMSIGQTTAVVFAQTEEKILAVVNGRKITEGEVDKSIAGQLVPLQQQLYALRKVALDNLVLRVLLEVEAKRRGIPIEALKRELTSAQVEVPEGDVEETYAENRQAFGGMSEDEAKERLRLDLESEARMRNYSLALAKLKESARIELYLAEPRLPIEITLAENAPVIGKRDAAVTIIEFSDFQCPFCKGVQTTLKKILQAHGNNVRLVFRHLPLEIHPQALPSARAAFCAGEQNRFWQYHDALFASEELSPETFNAIASRLGLDLQQFQTCVTSESSRLAVVKDSQEARRLGINGTPSFIINGTLLRGAPSFEDFNGIIMRQLKTSQLTDPQQ